jgi:hypothetical protein
MKRPRQRIAPLSPREKFYVRQALLRHEEIMRERQVGTVEQVIRHSQCEGEYERFRVMAALRHAGEP